MSDPRLASAELLSAAASDLVAVFGSLHELKKAVVEVRRRAHDAGRQLTRADLASLRPLLRRELRRQDALVAGTGVLTRPGLLRDAPMFVEWWCAGPSEPFPLPVSLDPEHPVFSDYDTFEWFEGPWQEGSKRIVGPWVDYTATGQHVMTLSIPIFGGDGEFLGVAGADVLAGQIEKIALKPLRAISNDAALVSAEGRVLASNTARLLVGSLLDEPNARWAAEAGRGWTVRDDGVAASRDARLPWSVVVFPRRYGAGR
jgi:hypothetical protein